MASDLLLLIISYLLGSIPCGLILARIAGIGDIRTAGSGNIGATNVLRVGGKKLGVLTLLLDVLKGLIATSIVNLSHDSTILFLGAFICVVGHVFPVWLKFKGGKGVATGIAVLLVCNWHIGVFIIASWILVFAISRISSLAAIVAFALAPVFAFIFISTEGIFYLSFGLSILIIARHHTNIRRLLTKKEGAL